MNRHAYWVFGLVLLGSVAVSTVLDVEHGRAGQVVFRPVPAIEGAVLGAADGLTIRRCEVTQEGLEVTGHVTEGDSPRVVLVTVTPDAGEASGLRVGMAYEAQIRSGARVGDFVVVLPWAGRRSSFALAGTSSGEAASHGPVLSCP